MTCPSQAALHLVGNEQRAGPAADVGDRVGELARKRTDAAFSPDRLGDERRSTVRDGGGERVRLRRVHERRFEQWHEWRAIVLVVCDRQRTERPTAEGAFDRNECSTPFHTL